MHQMNHPNNVATDICINKASKLCKYLYHHCVTGTQRHINQPSYPKYNAVETIHISNKRWLPPGPCVCVRVCVCATRTPITHSDTMTAACYRDMDQIEAT